MKKNIFTKILGILLAITCITSCNSVDCPLNNTVYNTWTFYQEDEPVSITKEINVFLKVNGGDSLVVNKLTNAKSFSMPMSYYNPSDTVVIEYRNTSGTYIIEKDNLPHFNSPECGVWVEHNVTSIKGNHPLIDSVVVTNPKVDNIENENFRIYFK
ncbi:MAG: DUF6452 family protein [Bacteroidaceae bacterium]|nr:DUF6452 family protein [Bacteroidaceae bacterium]